jgi:hypothetical protein
MKMMWKEAFLHSRAVPHLLGQPVPGPRQLTCKETLHFGAEMLTAARYPSATLKSDCVPQVDLFVVLSVAIA